jgi:N-methylhydantoinase A
MTGYAVAVDIGGTFTDCVVVDGDGRRTISKALSTPGQLEQGVLDALAINATERGISRGELLGSTVMFVHGTTQATNALLTRQGAITGVITTRGHEDALIIGKVYSKVAGLPERELIHASRLRKPEPVVPRAMIQGVTERVDRDGKIVVALDERDAVEAVERLCAAGVEAIAVSLLWSFLNPSHELRIAELISQHAPDVHIALSHDVAPVLGEYERTATTAISAYVGPRVAGYLEVLERRLSEEGMEHGLLVMQASGGLTSVADATRRPIVTLDSGPTGGVLGSKYVGAAIGEANLICTDVGGTSFDVGLVLAGEVPLDPEPVVGQYTLRMPKVLVESIGAGGGSIAWVDQGGLLRVGPRSAGSTPGPACYGRGGSEPTVTDADLVLGYLNPDAFAGGAIRLDRELALAALTRLGGELSLEPEEAAIGIGRIVNAQMADLVRRCTIEQGHDPRACVLVAYGGAGPTHAAFYGADIGARAILIPADSTVFSAEGMLTCDVTHTVETSHRVQAPLGGDDLQTVAERFAALRRRVLAQFDAEGTAGDQVSFEHSVGARFPQQVHTLSVALPNGDVGTGFGEELSARFLKRYREVFGRGAVFAEGGLEVDFLRVVGRRAIDALALEASDGASAPVEPTGARGCWFEQVGVLETAVYAGADLGPGHDIAGPAIIERMGDSVVVPPGYRATVDERLIIRLVREGQ